MLYGKTISLVIPCKNEAEALPEMAAAVPDFIDEVILVDNNSNDQTLSVAKSLGFITVSEKRHVKGIGYGYAYQTGINRASGDLIVAMDGDGSYPLDRLNKIIETMMNRSLSFVSCRRFPLSSQRDMALLRQFGSKFLTLVFNILFDRNLGDILTGMWIMDKDIIPYLDLTPGDWNFSISIKGSAALSPIIRFGEIHIPYHDRHLGTSKQSLFSTGMNHFSYLLRSKWRYLRALDTITKPALWPEFN